MSDSWTFFIIVHLERLIIWHVLMNLVLILNIAIFFHLFLVMLFLKHEVNISKKANGNFKKTWELLFFLGSAVANASDLLYSKDIIIAFLFG